MTKRKAQAGRKLVSLPNKTYETVERLQRELSAVSGKRFTIGDVVARGAQCLLDAASRHACFRRPNRKNHYGSGYERR